MLRTAYFPISNKVLVATFADDTAILASHEDPSTASENLQNELKETEDWLTKWRIQASENKSVHVTFGTRIENCPPVTLYNEELPEVDDVKYLVGQSHFEKKATHSRKLQENLVMVLQCLASRKNDRGSNPQNRVKQHLELVENLKLRVFENKVLRKIFGAKRDEVTGEWRKLHNTELHTLYSSPDIIRNIKSRRLRWAGHVARMGESTNAYRMLVGRSEGKRLLGRPRRRWEDNIKMDLRELGYDDRDWINLAQNREQWRAYMRAAMNLRVP
ncbi:hypothetical protein ANN_20571 [Periplaneta americana]|uniref:Reverse transcriptase domain-containing protein n=1 Tax=Periplaneta americana TaxID=6978 RepID=A0ABQ8SEA9_PERAM|nr:hypothetical protein ANN_20571 [Periplaneta americana]